MGAILDTAQAILDFARGCVGDCSLYSRQFVYIGRPVIDCDTLAVSIGNSDALSITDQCTIHQTRFTVTLARCCMPPVGSDGSPPSPEAITAAISCLMVDVEALLCCLGGISLEGSGVVGRCRPKVIGTQTSNPTGNCAAVEILMSIETKVCCDA